MRVFATAIRSLHVFAFGVFDTVTHLPGIVRLNRDSEDWQGLTGRVRHIARVLLAPIQLYLYYRPLPGERSKTRHQRDLIRRRIRMLLIVLGDTPEAIQATLCRLHSVGDFSPAPEWHTPLERYLYVRTGRIVEIGPLLVEVDYMFKAVTPKNIRRYLASASYTNDL